MLFQSQKLPMQIVKIDIKIATVKIPVWNNILALFYVIQMFPTLQNRLFVDCMPELYLKIVKAIVYHLDC